MRAGSFITTVDRPSVNAVFLFPWVSDCSWEQDVFSVVMLLFCSDWGSGSLWCHVVYLSSLVHDSWSPLFVSEWLVVHVGFFFWLGGVCVVTWRMVGGCCSGGCCCGFCCLLLSCVLSCSVLMRGISKVMGVIEMLKALSIVKFFPESWCDDCFHLGGLCVRWAL